MVHCRHGFFAAAYEPLASRPEFAMGGSSSGAYRCPDSCCCFVRGYCRGYLTPPLTYPLDLSDTSALEISQCTRNTHSGPMWSSPSSPSFRSLVCGLNP